MYFEVPRRQSDGHKPADWQPVENRRVAGSYPRTTREEDGTPSARRGAVPTVAELLQRHARQECAGAHPFRD